MGSGKKCQFVIITHGHPVFDWAIFKHARSPLHVHFVWTPNSEPAAGIDRDLTEHAARTRGES
jgi:hypothetical protein